MEKTIHIVDEIGKLKGLITSKDIANKSIYPNASLDLKSRLLVGAAIGVKEDAIERAKVMVPLKPESKSKSKSRKSNQDIHYHIKQLERAIAKAKKLKS